ncbi:MAG: hypothetical protein ACOY94_06525 [Bacillota bacterium]
MQLADREWLLFCEQCGEWTGLHRFLDQRGHFQGERSLTLNAYLNSDLLLGKFLIHHANHPVVPVPDLTDEYLQVKLYKDRFLEGLIDQVVGDRIQRDLNQQADRDSLRREGYHTLLALRKLYGEKLKELESQHPDEPAQAKVHLGRTLGIEWCLAQIDRLLEIGRAL